jgi:undecaprenyl-diphosphatase
MGKVPRVVDGEGEMDTVTSVIVESPSAVSVPTRRADAEAARPSDPADPCGGARPCLHQHPPATPIAFFAGRRKLLVTIATLFAFFATAAAIANAWLLRRWDVPLQRFVEENRTGALDTFFLTMSRFGSTFVVLAIGGALTLLTWRRCRAVAIAVAAATLARPLLEFTVKAVVGRDRPDFERMVAGNGPSFPSGHVMAAIALWGLLPLVVGLFTRNRVLWWISAFTSGFMIVTIAASRVYLGVHWPSDIFAGLLLGTLFLIGVEFVLGRAHDLSGCGAAQRTEASARARAR